MKDYTNSQTTPLVINTLDTKRPWYSAKSQDLIKPDSIKEYSNADNSFLSEMFFSHTIGKTNYELTNHLGNVQAVVKDKRLTKALSGDSNLVYRPSLHAYYDYYPFGMLMPGRYAQDTQINCYTVTKYEEYQKSTKGLVALGVPGGFFKIGTNSNTDAIGTATLGESEMDTMRYLDISDNTGGTGSTTALNIPSTDVGYEQELIVSNITGSYVAIVKQEVDNAWVELDSREITATGLYTLEFTPTTTNVKLDIINTNTGSYTHALRLTGPAASKDRDVLPLARTYTLCDRPRDSYRFGFNGKEKDNEFAGIGNHYAALFGEYEPRVVTRWNTDPKPTVGISPYAMFRGNPIWNSDPLLDSIRTDVYSRDLDNGTGGFNRLTYKSTEKDGYGFYNENGELYSGDDPFVKDLEYSLGRIGVGKEGRELVDNLISHSSDIVISKNTRKNVTNPDNGNIGWNPKLKLGGFDQNGSRATFSWVSLAHELGHSLSVVKKISLPAGFWSTEESWDEINASHWENKIRSENGFPLRTHYSVQPNSNGGYNPDPATPLLRAGTNTSLHIDINQNVHYGGVKGAIKPYNYGR